VFVGTITTAVSVAVGGTEVLVTVGAGVFAGVLVIVGVGKTTVTLLLEI
jgi:prefoldin subunit 5